MIGDKENFDNYEIQQAIANLDKALKTQEGLKTFFRIRIYKIILSDDVLANYFYVFGDEKFFYPDKFESKIKEWFDKFNKGNFEIGPNNILEYKIIKENVLFSGFEDMIDDDLSEYIIGMLGQEDGPYENENLKRVVRSYARSRLASEMEKLSGFMSESKVSKSITDAKNELLKTFLGYISDK